MKIVRWSFNNLHIPVLQDDQGNLFCTTKQIAEALGVTEQAIRTIALRNNDKLRGLSVTDRDAKTLKSNKVELGIARVRKDMKIWSESDMIRIALWSRSEVADEFTDHVIKFVRDNAKINSLEGYVTKEEYNNLCAENQKLLIELGRQSVEIEQIKRILSTEKPVKLRLVQ